MIVIKLDGSVHPLDEDELNVNALIKSLGDFFKVHDPKNVPKARLIVLEHVVHQQLPALRAEVQQKHNADPFPCVTMTDRTCWQHCFRTKLGKEAKQTANKARCCQVNDTVP